MSWYASSGYAEDPPVSSTPKDRMEPHRPMNSLKGHLLIATPDLLAPLFARSVILIIDHDEEGAMGVILNRPTEASVSDLAGKIFEEDFSWEKPLHLGGPVSGPLMVLHALPDL